MAATEAARRAPAVCRELRRGMPRGRELARRVRRRAWELAARAYERYADTMAEQLAGGDLAAEQIDAWEPGRE